MLPFAPATGKITVELQKAEVEKPVQATVENTEHLNFGRIFFGFRGKPVFWDPIQVSTNSYCTPRFQVPLEM